ncbi:MAG: YbaK/EbsC family protein [Rhodospirillales bacterium]|jgi:prolyl-tRNA editing enzyme YbaK/EbsC (Cys-tRNA(Pro) deacylase)|nr:YbaK/EbsC family protein [Rhodospirillales bacterium]
MAELEVKGGYLEKEPVRRVRQFLLDVGYGDRVIELDDTARSAQDAANSVGTELGSIVKSLTFMIGETMVMALVAGDHHCVPESLARALNMEGNARRPEADEVKNVTGFSIGGVAPVASNNPMPLVIDHSLKRFETVYAAAGHPHCIFPVTVGDLKRLTGGIVSYSIAKPIE